MQWQIVFTIFLKVKGTENVLTQEEENSLNRCEI